jgi:GntR family transcriptional repressor for pyruvate dehydrogenase complex
VYSQLHSARLYEQVVNQIEANIHSGNLRAGDKLPPERELGAQFGVSRTVVREAIKALRQKGLVEIQPGKGTYVTDGTSEAMKESIGHMVKIDRARGLANLMQVREMLEPEIAANAAASATPGDLADMRSALDAMENSLADADAFIEADQQFHLALAKATGNQLLLRLIDPIVDLLMEQRLKMFYAGTGAATRGQYHHKRIFEAIDKGDADAARREMIAHLEQVRKDSGFS